MKKIVVLEDRPSRLKNFVCKVNENPENEMQIGTIFYYKPKLDQESDEIKEMQKDLGVDVQVVNIWNFRDKLDELYKDPNTMFIFDTDLGEILEENVFSYRINVNYAMRKKNENEHYKIWFYTVAGPDFEKDVKSVFPEHVLEAHMDNDQIELDLGECATFQKAIKTVEAAAVE